MNKQLIITNAEGEQVKAEYSTELASGLLAMGINIEQELTQAINAAAKDEDVIDRRS
jgi:hypothetical protein